MPLGTIPLNFNSKLGRNVYANMTSKTSGLILIAAIIVYLVSEIDSVGVIDNINQEID